MYPGSTVYVCIGCVIYSIGITFSLTYCLELYCCHCCGVLTGFPLTDTGVSSSACIVTGHDVEAINWDGMRSCDTLVSMSAWGLCVVDLTCIDSTTAARAY